MGPVWDQPSGIIRITESDDVIAYIRRPRIDLFIEKYPDAKIAIHANRTLLDIVVERFDARSRLGNRLKRT